MTDRCIGFPYTHKAGASSPRHKWQACINAYSRGLVVQYRNNGGNEGHRSEWHDVTDDMVERRGLFAGMAGFGSMWEWPWLEFRIKPAQNAVDVDYRMVLRHADQRLLEAS